MAKTITRDELHRAIETSSVTVVETLREEHFAQGHLPGAIHIHFEQIARFPAHRVGHAVTDIAKRPLAVGFPKPSFFAALELGKKSFGAGRLRACFFLG